MNSPRGEKVAPVSGKHSLRGSHRREFHTGMTSYRVYIMTGSFHISLFEGTLHVDKIPFSIPVLTGLGMRA